MSTKSRFFMALTASAACLLHGGTLRADLLDDEEGADKRPTETHEQNVDGLDHSKPEMKAGLKNPHHDDKGSKHDAGELKKSTDGSSERGKEVSGEAPGGPDASKRSDGNAPSPHPRELTTPTSTTTVIPPKKNGSAKVNAPAGTGAPSAKTRSEAPGQEPVHFDSKGLKGMRDKGVLELLQDVVVTQGDMRLEAEHAQVYFDEGAKEKKERGLIKVVAEGAPVKIFGVDGNSGEKFKAFGSHAVFLNRERVVVLEGDARLWRGDDSVIRSRKITYEMNTGWIKADRVAGELMPAEKTPAGGAGKKPGNKNKKPSESSK